MLRDAKVEFVFSFTQFATLEEQHKNFLVEVLQGKRNISFSVEQYRAQSQQASCCPSLTAKFSFLVLYFFYIFRVVEVKKRYKELRHVIIPS